MILLVKQLLLPTAPMSYAAERIAIYLSVGSKNIPRFREAGRLTDGEFVAWTSVAAWGFWKSHEG